MMGKRAAQHADVIAASKLRRLRQLDQAANLARLSEATTGTAAGVAPPNARKCSARRSRCG